MSGNWRLVIWSVPDRNAALLMRYRFKRTKGKASWHRTFSPKDRALAKEIQSALLAAGLKGKWFPVTKRASPKAKRSPRLELVTDTKAQELQARAQVANILARKELRLANEALKRATEIRKQAEIRARREVNERVRLVIAQATGKLP